jgi:hypothetical protein
VLVGAVVLGFIVKIYVEASNTKGGQKKPQWDVDDIQENLFSSSATCTVLALACVVSLAIDSHIRVHTATAAQVGIWIKECVEAPIFGKDSFTGWETFLHNPLSGENEKGMHADDLYRFLWPHLNILTWLVYVTYMMVLFRTLRTVQSNRRVIFIGFILVHLSLLA